MLNSIKLKFAKSVKNKRLNVFGLFFLIAFLILVVTKLSDTYVDTIPFNVKYKNLPETTIITLDSTPKVNVTVSTHGFNLLSYYFYNNTYVLDFEKSAYTKDNAYVWLAEKGSYNIQEQLGQSVKIVSVKPDTLFLPYGNLSFKMVPVILTSKINFAPGYDALNDIQVVPDSVKIIGTKEDIDTIQFIETKPFDLNNVKSNINIPIALDFESQSERFKLSEETVRVQTNVEKFTEGTFEIPITILNKPDAVELNYFPKHITVAYYLSLKDYKAVKPSDFKIECNYNDVLNSERSYFEPELVVTSNKVKMAKMKQNKVEYIIVK